MGALAVHKEAPLEPRRRSSAPSARAVLTPASSSSSLSSTIRRRREAVTVGAATLRMADGCVSDRELSDSVGTGAVAQDCTREGAAELATGGASAAESVSCIKGR